MKTWKNGDESHDQEKQKEKEKTEIKRLSYVYRTSIIIVEFCLPFHPSKESLS